MFALESPQHIGAFAEEDTRHNNWIARARVLVHELPQLYLRDFDFDELIRVLTQNGNLDLLDESIERVNRENGVFPFFDFEDRQITINGERQSIQDLFEMDADAGEYLNEGEGYNEIDGDIISTLEEIVGLYPELNPISREYWISRARALVDDLPQLELNNFDFDNLIDFLERKRNIQHLDDSRASINEQEPDSDFGDEEIEVNGEQVLLNDYFEGLNTSCDGDILSTLMLISWTYPAEEYPELYQRIIKQKTGGKSRKANKKSNKKANNKSNKKSNKKTNKKTNKKLKKAKKTRKTKKTMKTMKTKKQLKTKK